MKDRRPPSPGDETRPEVERLLRALAEQAPGDDLPAPDDERLRAYRAGRLAAGEAAELEARLAGSAAGRRRLLELAGVDHSLPLRRVRKAVLGVAQQRRPALPWTASAAVAAALLVAVLSALLLLRPGTPGPPAYDVAVRGLAEVRSAAPRPAAAGPVRAYPGTTLRIFVQAREETPAGASFALFRRGEGELRRVAAPAEVRVAGERGSATFEGEASRVLASRAPGAHPLYVVVSTGVEPPSRVALAPGQDPAGALRSSGRLVYPLTVTLLADEPPAKEGAR